MVTADNPAAVHWLFLVLTDPDLVAPLSFATPTPPGAATAPSMPPPSGGEGAESGETSCLSTFTGNLSDYLNVIKLRPDRFPKAPF